MSISGRPTRLGRACAAACLCMLLAGAVGCSSSNDAATPQLERYPADSMLVDALGLDDSPEQFTAYAVLIRQRTTECMRERGFDLPILPVEAVAISPMGALWNEMDELAFAREYGFGAFFSGVTSASATTTDTALEDYIASLDPNEAEAFTNEFYGDPFEGTFEASCMYAGQIAADAESNQQWDLFSLFTYEIIDRTNADPRVVRLHATYAACMSDKGYNYAAPDEARQAASDRFGDFMSTTFPSNVGDGDMRSSLAPADQAKFDATQQQEIDEAVASLECEVPIRSQLIDIGAEIQADWLAENGDRIAAMRATDAE